MADSRLPALTEISAPVLLDEYYTVDVSDTTDHASGTSRKISGERLGGLLGAGLAGGRLTTESGVAISTSDRTSQGTLYYTPYPHDLIRIYDGTRWKLYKFTERSLALSMTSGVNYDVFIYDNAGTLTLELTAWSNDTTRATALTTQDGVLVKTGATTRLYLGTIRASGSNVTEDSLQKRFVWNFYNQVSRGMQRLETADSWTYSTDAWRAMNNSSSNRLEIVNGVAGENVLAQCIAYALHSASTYWAQSGIGYDSTTAFASGCLVSRSIISTTAAHSVQCVLSHTPAAGYHYYSALEYAYPAVTTTWYGDAGAPTVLQAGIIGRWSC
jgi:hypothetical protein